MRKGIRIIEAMLRVDKIAEEVAVPREDPRVVSTSISPNWKIEELVSGRLRITPRSCHAEELEFFGKLEDDNPIR